MDNLDNLTNKVIANIIGANGGQGGGTNPVDPENPDTPVTPPTPEGPETPAGWDNTKVYAYKSKDNKVVPVPNGFTVSEVAEEQSVDTGLVIKIEQDGITSEFVWVPVADTSEMFGENGGRLYDFGTSSSPNNPPTEIAYSSTGNREPDYLTDTTYGDASEYSGKGIELLNKVIGLSGSNNEILTQWQNQLQKEFNDMKASVEKYNGFYIGRYETGNLSQNKAVVAKNNSDIANQNWYTMYQKSKTIANGTNATSSMIWGSQWDAMLKWFLSDSNIAGYVYESTGKGNYGTGGVIPTGSNDEYKLKNIYDIAGNELEWTIEASGTSRRLHRRRRRLLYWR